MLTGTDCLYTRAAQVLYQMRYTLVMMVLPQAPGQISMQLHPWKKKKPANVFEIGPIPPGNELVVPDWFAFIPQQDRWIT